MASEIERGGGGAGCSNESELRGHYFLPSHLISTWAEILRGYSQFAGCDGLLGTKISFFLGRGAEVPR